ncbi:hypothetical protein [Candidatus Chloroploca asiatica]|uniref:Uncharacterized protein n=1 Tax=Candidatus Chloroploca asiatica TaxID=1506545 RepID=A0A2H3KM32_9CHLR|nr:hypothetical protein [Candidatus Chloroploca asiatica]PDV99085.1 hypothetical protein A9Q02_13460 [Candidatus Chloroploca asiatica]
MISTPVKPDVTIAHAVAKLDAWFETMRGPGGYGGPVAHWWQQSLLYTGAGLDWRYEGIISGYLTLWERTGAEQWLAKARRAGDDLVAGQLPNGHFVASAFEINPASAGTPHEAACAGALLLLALALRQAKREGWHVYATAAQHNLEQFYLGQLWDKAARSFRDSPLVPSFVPNKAATACETLFLQAELSGEAHWIEQYALPNLDRILAHQVRGGSYDGAIAQNSFGERVVDKYFPVYIVRCVPALLRGFTYTRQERYLDAAIRALLFVLRQVDVTGALPTAIYANGHKSHHPSWIAPLGDVLYVITLLRPHGLILATTAIEARLLAGQSPTGGIATATGFAGQANKRPSQIPDFRDLLPVAGWCHKAFRYLASCVTGELPVVTSATYETECTFGGRCLHYRETPDLIEACNGQEPRYRWFKSASRPEVAREEFWVR